MTDLIERAGVIDALSWCNEWDVMGFAVVDKDDAIRQIKSLPSAEPERKKGHWINAECKDGTIAHKCSECKCFVGYSVSSLTWFNFCPWCGADMRGGNDG